MTGISTPSLDRLLAVMRRLRDPVVGCEWDRVQTFATIAPYTIEEAYEVADAIARDDMDELRSELGDLLLQVVFHSRIAEEMGAFAFDDVAAAIVTKLETRHPHIFGDGAADVTQTERWETIKAAERPIVIITSNNEKELPDAFLRRCFFHYIKFPDRQTMQEIINVHFPDIQGVLVKKAMDIFYEVRDVPGLKKKPSTSELLDWLKLILNEDMPLEVLQSKDSSKAIPPLHGALLKNEQDVMLFERLAFMAKREAR